MNERVRKLRQQSIDTRPYISTERAELMAAEAICRKAGILIPPWNRSTEVRETGRRRVGQDLFRLMGIEVEDRIEDSGADRPITVFDVFQKQSRYITK